MDTSTINKIWGIRRRILLTETTETDLITVKKDCYCSTHNHDRKVNKFSVITGLLRIETDYGNITLGPGEECEVYPPRVHRFYAVEDSLVIESAYVNEGQIDAKDISRISQGGRIIDNKEVTLKEMEERGILDLPQVEDDGRIIPELLKLDNAKQVFENCVSEHNYNVGDIVIFNPKVNKFWDTKTGDLAVITKIGQHNFGVEWLKPNRIWATGAYDKNLFVPYPFDVD